MHDITQTPVQFGPGNELFGMLTVPGHQAPAHTVCLMFNMGANHRVGPHRINVKLAHALAARGVGSLRFDLGGIGDSRPMKTSPDIQIRAVHCLQAAMDLVTDMLGARQFVIVAMCSGVAQSMSVAVVDPRVIGLSLFDGFSFLGRRSRFERNLRRILAAPAHPAFRGKVVRWLSRTFGDEKANAPLPDYFAEEIAPEDNKVWVGDKLRELVEKRVAVQLLYSGSLHVSDRGLDQLGRLAHEPFAKALHYQFMPDVDHTVCTQQGQRILLKAVGDWVTSQCFSTRAPANDVARPRMSRTEVLPGSWAVS